MFGHFGVIDFLPPQPKVPLIIVVNYLKSYAGDSDGDKFIHTSLHITLQ